MIDRDFEAMVECVDLPHETGKCLCETCRWSDKCLDCLGRFSHGTCCCALRDKIQEAFAPWCAGCRGETDEHSHWIKNISYSYEPNDSILIEESKINFDECDGKIRLDGLKLNLKV